MMRRTFSRFGFLKLRKLLTQPGEFLVLGIETSCDDTGAAVVSSRGRILSDERQSQLDTHLLTGGIVPSVAGQLHQQNIETVVSQALDKAHTTMEEIRAIAVTQGPGLALSLAVGVNHALKLSCSFRKPLIAVHHMEAHALTVRLLSSVPFPFLVLLVSGGHCILAVCESFGKFFRLGQTLDDSPGEAFDKVSRMLRLHLHPLGRGLSGGAAVEAVSKLGNPSVYPLPLIMSRRLDCNFSFAGIKTSVRRTVAQLEALESNSWDGESVLNKSNPVVGCEDIAASFQRAVCSHLVNRTERAIQFCKQKWPCLSDLVVSGGVASNYILREQLKLLARQYGINLSVPLSSLCTDNGVMIAWTGVEHINAGFPFQKDNKEIIEYHPRWPLGEDISKSVSEQRIKVKKPTYCM